MNQTGSESIQWQVFGIIGAEPSGFICRVSLVLLKKLAICTVHFRLPNLPDLRTISAGVSPLLCTQIQ
jgi:hypothetical protein